MDILDLGSGHFVALRFAHLQYAFFQRRFGIFARCIRCSMSHCYLRRARKSLECIFFSDLARLRDLLACLKLYLVFSLVDLLWFRPRPSWTQLCACTAAGTCSTSRDFSSRRPFLAHAFRVSSCLVVLPLFILTRCPIRSEVFVSSRRSTTLTHSTTGAPLSRAARPPSPSKTKGLTSAALLRPFFLRWGGSAFFMHKLSFCRACSRR